MSPDPTDAGHWAEDRPEDTAVPDPEKFMVRTAHRVGGVAGGRTEHLLRSRRGAGCRFSAFAVMRLLCSTKKVPLKIGRTRSKRTF